MPTPDASQFTQKKKFNALQERSGYPTNQGVKYNSHLYQYVPTTSGLSDFLPSFSNKFVQPKTYTPLGVPTGKEAKPKRPY